MDEVEILKSIKNSISSLKAFIEKKLDNKDMFKNNEKYLSKKLSKKHTILIPHISYMHDRLISHAFNCSGYSVKILPRITLDGFAQDSDVKKEGNCFLNSIIVSQILSVLKSKENENGKISVMLTQVEGICERKGFIDYLSKNLKKAGFEGVPIITLDIYNLNRQIGFRLAATQFKRIITAFMYSDLLKMMDLRVRPYIKSNDKDAFMFLLELWIKRCEKSLEKVDFKDYENDVFEMTEDFSAFPIDKNLIKQRLGVVGNSFAVERLTNDDSYNNNLEVVSSNLSDFFFYNDYNKALLNNSKNISKLNRMNLNYISQMLKKFRDEVSHNLERNERFDDIIDVKERVKEVVETFSIDVNNDQAILNLIQVIGLIEQGVEKIVLYRCSDCFKGTLGKKIIKNIKAKYKDVDILQVEYDKSFNLKEEMHMLGSSFIDDAEKSVMQNITSQ